MERGATGYTWALQGGHLALIHFSLEFLQTFFVCLPPGIPVRLPAPAANPVAPVVRSRQARRAGIY